jgi:hypothetical protein
VYKRTFPMKRALIRATASCPDLLPRAGLVAGLAALVTISATLLGAPSVAQAQQDDPNKLMAEGIVLRKQGGQDEEAARLFQKAYDISHSVRAVAHLGTTEYNLKRFVEAEVHLAEALRSRNDPWIEERRTPIKQTLDLTRAELGWLQVVGRPAGADVEIAGRQLGKLPLREPIRAEAGEVYVRVSKDGYETYRKSIFIPKEGTANAVVELEKAEAPMAPRGRDPGGGGPGGGSAAELRGGSSNANNWRWPAAWVSAGFAVLLTGTGTTFALIHNSKVADFSNYVNPMTKRNQCTTALPTDQGGGPCPGLLAEANQAKSIAVASFIGAGATAILATVLFATAPSLSDRSDRSADARSERANDARVAAAPRLLCLPDLLAGGSGATCHYRF